MSNILSINLIKYIGRNSVRDFAEAGQPRKEGKWNPEMAETYLSGVDATLSDPTTRFAAKCECPVLSEIVEDASLPEPIHSRAARLRAIARDAA